MSEILRVDVEALRVMARDLSGEADTIGGIDPSESLAGAGSAMRACAAGAAAARAAAPLLQAYRGMADSVRSMSAATSSGANTYEALDESFLGQLRG